MSIIILCVFLIGLDSSKQDSSLIVESSGISQRKAALLAVFLGILIPLNFSIRATFLRLGKNKFSYRVWDLPIDGMHLEAFISTVILIVLSNEKITPGFEMSTNYILPAICASLFFTAGKQCIGLAYTTGLAGPANSIATT